MLWHGNLAFNITPIFGKKSAMKIMSHILCGTFGRIRGFPGVPYTGCGNNNMFCCAHSIWHSATIFEKCLSNMAPPSPCCYSIHSGQSSRSEESRGWNVWYRKCFIQLTSGIWYITNTDHSIDTSSSDASIFQNWKPGSFWRVHKLSARSTAIWRG